MRHYPPRAPQHPAGHWSTHRDRADQAHFRKTLIRRAGGQCEWAGCPATEGLQAHHTQPGNNDPDTGILLCRVHHKAIDPHAR